MNHDSDVDGETFCLRNCFLDQYLLFAMVGD